MSVKDNEVNIYNRIMNYYDHLDGIQEILEKSTNDELRKNAKSLEPMAKELRSMTEELTVLFVDYLKSEKNPDTLLKMKEILNHIIERVQECREKIYSAHVDKK